ncbi:MAG: hypothetical protein JKX72_05820 [Robiginitomaculum sp.]|nr:hypothetical protein [Robiginitomaculum sp.]
MKITRFFISGFAALLTITLGLFTPAFASTGGMSFASADAAIYHMYGDSPGLKGDLPLQYYRITVADDDFIITISAREKTHSFFDLALQRKLSWIATDAVKRTKQHKLWAVVDAVLKV